jgi:methionyl-tRNA formyltransferase
VRAFNPWPGTFTTWKGKPLKIHRAYAIKSQPGTPGTHTLADDLPAIYCGQGTLVLESLQPAGKKAMAGDVFLNGARDWQKTA